MLSYPPSAQDSGINVNIFTQAFAEPSSVSDRIQSAARAAAGDGASPGSADGSYFPAASASAEELIAPI